MKFAWSEVKCKPKYPGTHRQQPFRYLHVHLLLKEDPSDRLFLLKLYEQAALLASQVNSRAANAAEETRSVERLVRDSFAGLLAEHAWMTALNQLGLPNLVAPTTFMPREDQVDLVTTSGQTIEVRSSYPRNGIEFALCSPNYQFDVIGPYVNAYKSHESIKDFYVRTLFPFQAERIFGILRTGSLAFGLTGGATRSMFENPAVYQEKSLRPEESRWTGEAGAATNYRVIPFAQALDTQEMLEAISGALSDANLSN